MFKRLVELRIVQVLRCQMVDLFLTPLEQHLGFVVDDLDGVVARLQAAGHAIDHWGVDGPVRRSVYFSPPGLPQVEFVSYATADAAARNRYD